MEHSPNPYTPRPVETDGSETKGAMFDLTDHLTNEMLKERQEKNRAFQNLDKNLDSPWESENYEDFNLTDEFILKHIDKPWNFKRLTKYAPLHLLYARPLNDWDWSQLASKIKNTPEPFFTSEIYDAIQFINDLVKRDVIIDNQVYNELTRKYPIDFIKKNPNIPWDKTVVSKKILDNETLEYFIINVKHLVDFTIVSKNIAGGGDCGYLGNNQVNCTFIKPVMSLTFDIVGRYLTLPWDFKEMSKYIKMHIVFSNPHFNWDFEELSNRVTFEEYSRKPDLDWDFNVLYTRFKPTRQRPTDLSKNIAMNHLIRQVSNLSQQLKEYNDTDNKKYINFIESNILKFNLATLPDYNSFSLEFIRRNLLLQWNFRTLSTHPDLTLDFVNNTLSYKWDWDAVCQHPNILRDIVKEYFIKRKSTQINTNYKSLFDF